MGEGVAAIIRSRLLVLRPLLRCPICFAWALRRASHLRARSYARPLVQYCVKEVGGFALLLINYMGIDIQCGGDIGMAHSRLQRLHVHTY